MPRVYTPKPGGKKYKKYDNNIVQKALEEREVYGSTLQAVANKYNISKSALYRYERHGMNTQGGQTALSTTAEEYIVKNLNLCAERGYTLDMTDLRYTIKMYLDTQGVIHKRFKYNYPGPDYINAFLDRHRDKLSKRICSKIKPSLGAKIAEIIRVYFDQLSRSLENVPPSNIVTYVEINLSADPGCKKATVKYPENNTKEFISIIMAASADGELLPQYVVYKASHLHYTWMQNGPNDTRYNRSTSGRFNGKCLEDWIETVAIPFLEKKEGKKILIGDNLLSNLSLKVIKQCKEKNVSFVFLPANTTHLTQPLDGAFYRSVKMAWRQVLDQWRKTDERELKSLPNDCFPHLLSLLIEKVKSNSEKYIKDGFRETGIVPLELHSVLERIPKEIVLTNPEENGKDESFVTFLKEIGFGTVRITGQERKRKLDIVLFDSSEDEQEAEENNQSKSVNEVVVTNIDNDNALPSTYVGQRTTDQESVQNNKCENDTNESEEGEISITDKIDATMASYVKKMQVERSMEKPMQKMTSRQKQLLKKKLQNKEDKQNNYLYEDKHAETTNKVLEKEKVCRIVIAPRCSKNASLHNEENIEEINCNEIIEGIDYNVEVLDGYESIVDKNVNNTSLESIPIVYCDTDNLDTLNYEEVEGV